MITYVVISGQLLSVVDSFVSRNNLEWFSCSLPAQPVKDIMLLLADFPTIKYVSKELNRQSLTTYRIPCALSQIPEGTHVSMHQ